MADRSYRQAGLRIARGGAGARETQVRDLQTDLRRLGYLRRGIDGDFGAGTERAVRALQYDLLHNDGQGRDGDAPVRVRDYRGAREIAIDGIVDQDLAACIADMLADPRFPKLPAADDPAAANRQAMAQILADGSLNAPAPFLVAIFRQESGGRHFREPPPGDDDRYVVIGLDTNDANRDRITSRGYGIGQYTLFHHPPRPDEVTRCIDDPVRNVAAAADELHDKFAHFVNGDTPGTRADDRIAEIGDAPLRTCTYAFGDRRRLRDCRACARAAGTVDISFDETPYYDGADARYRATRYYKGTGYAGVPRRDTFPCDWPYALRRYNGSGPNAYNYQARVLLNLLDLP